MPPSWDCLAKDIGTGDWKPFLWASKRLAPSAGFHFVFTPDAGIRPGVGPTDLLTIHSPFEGVLCREMSADITPIIPMLARPLFCFPYLRDLGAGAEVAPTSWGEVGGLVLQGVGMDEGGADWDLAWACEMASACLGGQSCTWSRLVPSGARHYRTSGTTQSWNTKASTVVKNWRWKALL